MKLRPLPEIDLARVADKPTELKWSMLRSFKAGGGGWGYEPARSQVFNVFNPVDPIGLRVLQPTLSEIEQSVRNSCREASQEQSCVEVTRLLWDWARENSGGAIERLVPTMSIGQMASVRYWNNFVFLKAGRPTFLFLDHRRSKNLTQNAQRFALSMMHQQIRVADPDFSDAELCILQFPHPKGGRSTRSGVQISREPPVAKVGGARWGVNSSPKSSCSPSSPTLLPREKVVLPHQTER